MALCKPSVLGLISGKISGMEIAITKNGVVLKHQKPSKRLDSYRAQKSREGWNHRCHLWNELNADEVKAWETYAQAHPIKNRLGQPTYLNARASFMSNMLWGSTSSVLFNWVKTPLPPTGEFTSVTASLTAGGPYTITITHTFPVLFSTFVNVRVARFRPPHTTRNPSTWTNIGSFIIPIAPLTYYDQFLSRNVDLLAGERVALQFRLHWFAFLPSQTKTVWATVAP